MAKKAKATVKATAKATVKAKAVSAKDKKTIKATVLAEKGQPAALSPELQNVDPDELEEQQDAAAAAASGGGSGDAALAAAAGTTEMSASFKNFRHHPDMENFYRFIYENDLRHEALHIIDEMLLEKRNRRQVRMAKTNTN
ncbi:MAG: hypothetical protein A2583_04825 [Bdellovibrionales bacterium RIFOXYD1_FULL_53_11]|nr:MAG: hypothetical protein A2583_04825 [Bdellovibrionales bacterium RIFOXYD1_FULL_53_11]